MTVNDKITYLRYRRVVLNQLIQESIDTMLNGGPLCAKAAERRKAKQDQMLSEVTQELKELLSIDNKSVI